MVSCQCPWKETLIEKKTSGNKKQGQNKLRSQIKNVVVRATIKYIGHGEICKSCSLQLKQIIAIKIILLIILNVNLWMLTLFSFFYCFFHMLVALLFIFIIFVFFFFDCGSLGSQTNESQTW